MVDDFYIQSLVKRWNIDYSRNHPKIDISGSPQRSEFRTVIEDKNGNEYVLEEISKESRKIKTTISKTLFDLKSKQLYGIAPYLLSRDKMFIEEVEGKHWQVMPFIRGNPLKRPEYAEDAWRGEALADFLIDLRNKILLFEWDETFSLKEYIIDMMDKISENNPEVYHKIVPIFDHLDKNLFPEYDKIPLAFCHGDFHPLNVIWGEEHFLAIIDWEFLGKKPECYDAANMIGCLGMEKPELLKGEMASSFICELDEANFFSDTSKKFFTTFVLATRFAWLSEWLRYKDIEMIDLEIAYMNILKDLDYDFFNTCTEE